MCTNHRDLLQLLLAKHEWWVTLMVPVSQMTHVIYHSLLPLTHGYSQACVSHVLYLSLDPLYAKQNKYCSAALRALQRVLVWETVKLDVGHLGKCEAQLTHKQSSEFGFMPEVMKRIVLLFRSKRQSFGSKDQHVLAAKCYKITCIVNSLK